MAKIKIGNVLFNILTIVTVLAVGFIVFNMATGTKGYAVTSDSMSKTLEIGDAVFSRKVSFEDLKVGDIITVKVGKSGYFTHRIVEIDKASETVTTRGDANAANDPMSTPKENIVGKMWYSVPLIGYFSILLSKIPGTAMLIALVLIAAVLVAVNTVLTKKKRGDNNE